MEQRWPLHGIRLVTADLTLTAMTEPDLATVVDWMLPFVVRRDGAVIGVQWLEGPDHLTDRTVDSSSRWAATGSARCTQVEGIDVALPLFGLEPA